MKLYGHTTTYCNDTFGIKEVRHTMASGAKYWGIGRWDHFWSRRITNFYADTVKGHFVGDGWFGRPCSSGKGPHKMPPPAALPMSRNVKEWSAFGRSISVSLPGIRRHVFLVVLAGLIMRHLTSDERIGNTQRRYQPFALLALSSCTMFSETIVGMLVFYKRFAVSSHPRTLSRCNDRW